MKVQQHELHVKQVGWKSIRTSKWNNICYH